MSRIYREASDKPGSSGKESWGFNIQYVNHPVFTQYLICKYSPSHLTFTRVPSFSALLAVTPFQRLSDFSLSRWQIYNLQSAICLHAMVKKIEEVRETASNLILNYFFNQFFLNSTFSPTSGGTWCHHLQKLCGFWNKSWVTSKSYYCWVRI